MKTEIDTRAPRRLATLLFAALLLAPAGASGAPPESVQSQGQWWNTVAEEETPSSHYDSILYQDLGPILRELETASNRVQVEVVGQSAQGRNLFLAIVSAPETLGRLGRNQALRSLNVPTQLVIYPGQYHGLGKPSYVQDRIERMIDWYGRYLGEENQRLTRAN